jgi:hypothetical protein
MAKNNTENGGKEPNRKLVRQKQKPELEPEVTLTINLKKILAFFFGKCY